MQNCQLSTPDTEDTPLISLPKEMAIFVNLEDDDYSEESKETSSADLETEGGAMPSSKTECTEILSFTPHQIAPRDLTWLAAAWPVITCITSHLDHNDISNLASTCKQMRQNMLQYRKNLLDGSLACSTASREESAKPQQSTWLNQLPRHRKVLCARDLVARCGTCGEPTCRV